MKNITDDNKTIFEIAGQALKLVWQNSGAKTFVYLVDMGGGIARESLP